MKRITLGVLAMLAAGMLGACGGPSDPAVSMSKKAGQPPWDAAAGPFVAAGWKSGDKASWQAQMTQRAQNQNEYLRAR